MAKAWILDHLPLPPLLFWREKGRKNKNTVLETSTFLKKKRQSKDQKFQRSDDEKQKIGQKVLSKKPENP